MYNDIPQDAYAHPEPDDTAVPVPSMSYGPPPPGPSGMWFPMAFAMELLKTYFGSAAVGAPTVRPTPVGDGPTNLPPAPQGRVPQLVPQGAAARYAERAQNTQQYLGHQTPVRHP